MIFRKILFLITIGLIFYSCASVQYLPMETSDERASSALVVLGNPLGTYPVSNSDIPQLLEYCKDPNPAVRQMAIFQLQQLVTTSFYDDILPLILDGDLSVSRNAKELLLKNERESIPVFRKGLKSENRDMRLKALDLLVELNDKESLSDVIELFLDPDPDVVTRAINASAKLADVNDKILYETLLRTEIPMRVGIVKTFSKLGDPSVLGTLLPYFYDPEIKVQNAVKFAFIDFGDQSIPYLLNVLNNPVPQTQLAILGLLEALRSPETISQVIQLFSSENERVRLRAIYTVSTFKETAVDKLGESLQHQNENVIINSIDLLSRILTRDSLNYLVPLLSNDSPQIKAAVFKAILKFGDMAGDNFLKILDDRDRELYASAVKGLMLLKDIRLIIDSKTTLYNRNNRNRECILNASYSDLVEYLNSLKISGLIVRDFTFIKEISQSSELFKLSERDIIESGSRYTTFYISKNDFIKKSDEALKLSFTYMHNYMDSKNPRDLETAKKQQEFSEMFKKAAKELEDQLDNYIGSTTEEKRLITGFESSREQIIRLYESVSLNRKNLADDILGIYGLNYIDIVAGNLTIN